MLPLPTEEVKDTVPHLEKGDPHVCICTRAGRGEFAAVFLLTPTAKHILKLTSARACVGTHVRTLLFRYNGYSLSCTADFYRNLSIQLGWGDQQTKLNGCTSARLGSDQEDHEPYPKRPTTVPNRIALSAHVAQSTNA